MAKTFLEIFYKYHPNDNDARILSRAENIKIQADKDNRMMQVSVDFPSIVSKEEIYHIESEIRKAYQLNMVKLLPHYPADQFDSDYISELLRETETVGIVARGFFSKYRFWHPICRYRKCYKNQSAKYCQRIQKNSIIPLYTHL